MREDEDNHIFENLVLHCVNSQFFIFFKLFLERQKDKIEHGEMMSINSKVD